MNCPCSLVYVCAYILLFFSPTASKKKKKKKSGLVCSSLTLSSLILILPQRQKNSKDQLYTTTNKQTSSRVSFIYQCPIHLQLSDLEQSHLATIILDRQTDKLAGEKFFKRVPSVYVRVKGASAKVRESWSGHPYLSLPDFGWSVFGQLLPSMR